MRHFIDAQGRPVCSELSDRIISVELDRLKRIALVIGVAWGQEKVKAIKACLVGGYISALATDQATAEACSPDIHPILAPPAGRNWPGVVWARHYGVDMVCRRFYPESVGRRGYRRDMGCCR